MPFSPASDSGSDSDPDEDGVNRNLAYRSLFALKIFVQGNQSSTARYNSR